MFDAVFAFTTAMDARIGAVVDVRAASSSQSSQSGQQSRSGSAPGRADPIEQDI